MKRIFDEGLNIFEYEMSWNQISSAICIYISAVKNPQSVSDTEAYKL